jgi:type IV secretion system protein TrbL
MCNEYKRRKLSCICGLVLALLSSPSVAALTDTGVADNVLSRYSAAASAWGAIITSYSSSLFWTLALISMVWTFGMMALRKADIGEFFSEFIRFTIFTGLFWWLLINGPAISVSIMNSLRQIGAAATGSPTGLSPSGIIDIGFDIFSKVVEKSTPSAPLESAIGIVVALIILVVLTLVGVNMLLLLISGWILAYAGSFFLGFGGSRWTSEMAITYFKTVLGVGAQLFAMVLLVGIGKSFVDEYYTAMRAGIFLRELAVMLVVAIVLLALVRSVPPLIGSLAGGAGGMSSGFGAGALLGAATMGVAAIATAGAAVGAGAAGIAGGAHALMAAFSKASEAASAGAGGASSLLAAAGAGGAENGGSTAGESPLAGAMGNGDMPESNSAIFANPGSASQADTEGDTNGSGGGPASAADPQSDPSRGGASGQKSTAGNDAGAPGKFGSAKASASKAGKIAAGTVANLAQGSWDVAKAKLADLSGIARERIGETTGGKIAAAINVRGSGVAAGVFDADSLAAGSSEEVDADSEIAAFRDGPSKAA